MKCIWLGQAGFLCITHGGTTVMIDPYLSNTLEEEQGPAYHRQVPVQPEFLCTPDVLFEKVHRPLTVLAAEKAFWAMRQRYGGKAEFVLMTPGTEVTLADMHFTAVSAAHSDPSSIGFVLEADGVFIWHTGDTLFHRSLLAQRPAVVDLLILPINGKGNNMNAVDAVRLTRILQPAYVLPMHWDLFSTFGCAVQPFADLLAQDPVRVLIPAHYTEFVL